MNDQDRTSEEPREGAPGSTPPEATPPPEVTSSAEASPAAAVTQPSAAVSPPAEPTPARAAKPVVVSGPAVAGAVLEPVTASVTPTAPVEVARSKRPSRARWAVAGLIALVVVALSAAGLFALVGAQNEAVVASWTPSDAMVYFEVRGDLPGDQRQNLGRFLAHFPGFADQSTLDTKIDEALDRLVSRASDGKHDWSKEIKPWFGGQVGMSMSALPTAGTDPSTSVRFLVVATQKDPAAAIGWLKLSGAATTEEAYKDVTLTVFPHDHGPTVVATTTGGVLLVGDETSVKAAVDRNGSDGLASSKTFKTAMSSLSGDQLLRTYVDLKAYFDAVKAMATSVGAAGLTIEAALADRVPAWAAAGASVDSDALISDLAAPVVEGAPTIADSESVIAKHVPATTLALFETHDYGKQLSATLDQLRKESALTDALKQVDQAAAVLGGLDHLIGWIGDVGVVVTSGGTMPGGGLVIVPTDVDQATQIATQIRNLVALAGSSKGVTITDEPYGTGTITTIDLGDVSKLSGGSAMTLPFSGHVQISYTVQDGLVIVGAGPAWVKSIVDVKGGSSLADQARYKDAMNRVGARNATSMFIDLAAIRSLAEPLVAKLPGSNYATEIKPYVEPFDVFAAATQTSDGKNLARFVITVTNP
jgi:Protein of unknown function (DUF3352)